MAQKLKIIPLGGLEQVGMNMMIVQYGKQFIIIDAGLMFPEDDMPGIDFVLPDYTYIKENAQRLLGIILTHGHEDHVGGLPYLLKNVQAPVYGTKLTLGLAQSKLQKHKLKKVKLKEIEAGSTINLGPFQIQFFRVVHSIPDGVGLAVHTPIGTIVHSGDFKFDQVPIDGKAVDFGQLAELGRNGVLLFMSDSTNAEVSGITPPEKTVGNTLDNIFEKATGKIIIASFASHIHRVQQILDAAHHQKKEVFVSGRAMQDNIEIASKLGYLKIPDKLLISNNDLTNANPNNIVVLCTGSQGEPLSALTKIAQSEHKYVTINPGDTVIISAAPIPGNEKAVSKTINLLYKNKAELFYERISDVHVSGHACAEELKIMLNLIRPKYFMPIHGEFRHRYHHSKIAQNLGIDKKNIFLLENGEVLELNGRGICGKVGNVSSELVFVDGIGVGDVERSVLYDRRTISKDGICIAVIGIKKDSGKVAMDPVITLRGVIHPSSLNGLIDKAKMQTVIGLNELSGKNNNGNVSVIEKNIKNSLSKYFYEEIRRHPVIIPIILEV